MSDPRPNFMLRIHGLWMPAGARFVVHCGTVDEPYRGVPILTGEGWQRMPDDMWSEVSDQWAKRGEGEFWTCQWASRYMTPVMALMVKASIGDLMMNPRLIEGVDQTTVIPPDDPRIGWSA